MKYACRFFPAMAASLALLSILNATAHAQASYPPQNDLPNPYKTVSDWAKLPDGRKWGATSGVSIGPDGNIWTYERCGGNGCANSNIPPILEFDPSGKLLKNFGAGLFVLPHGISVDNDGNVWVTDGVGALGTPDDVGKHGKGHQVFKFSPDGKILMVLGKAGQPGNTHDAFNRPSAVLVAPNGDIFVADGHSSPPESQMNARIVKFSKDGKFIKEWGMLGTGPGEFNTPHALALDSRGRLFIADRANNRIQIFTQDGKYLNEWKQFGRPSGIFIAKDDTMYVADSESRDTPGYGNNPGCERGMRIGSAKTGIVAAFIPDPDPRQSTSAAEGVAVDSNGIIYGAEVGSMDLKKYVKN